MLKPSLFFKWFGTRKKEGKYKRYSIIFFPIFWDITSADSYSSMNIKHPKLYVRPYCISTTLQFTDINE